MSYQASYRNFKDYTNCNRPGRWVNQWFWMDIETVRRYADELNVRFIYDDTRGDTDRYVAKQIQQRTFSKEAQRVLDLATELWVDTLKGRDTNRVGLHQNIAISLIAVFGLLYGVLTGNVNMAVGVILHHISMLAVVVNAMRLMPYKPNFKIDKSIK